MTSMWKCGQIKWMRIKIFILMKPNFNGFHVETVFKSIFRSNHRQFKDQQISHKWQRVEWHEANKNQHLKLGCWNFDVVETSKSIPQKWSIKTILMQINTSLWCQDPNRYQNETSASCWIKNSIPFYVVSIFYTCTYGTENFNTTFYDWYSLYRIP